MALVWPDQKVALEIVDDPFSPPFDKASHPEYEVVQITCAQMDDFEERTRVLDGLCVLLGQDPPEKTPEWTAANKRLCEELKRGHGIG